MAFDAPRKTLDEIRREIDAEFGPPPVTDAPAEADVAERARPDRVAGMGVGEDDAAIDELRQRLLRPRTGRAGYIIAGLIGCVVG